MLDNAKAANLLSMAQRAGRIVSGGFAVEKALKEKKACLVLLASDASEETAKNYQELATKHGVKLITALTKESLGHCLGKEYRAVAALLDEGFAKALQRLDR